MRDSPPLSRSALWNMNFGFLGIQFGWGLQMANMSPIYKYLGAADEQIARLWIAAPLTGFLVQPIIGAMSDRTWCRLGRRRPYFLVGAILSALALVLMPNAGSLAGWLVPNLPKFYFAAALLWAAASYAFSWYVSTLGNYTAAYGSLATVVVFMTWLWLSATIVLAGAELNAELEHQTAHDTTTGRPKPLGARGATLADRIGPPRAG